VVKPLGAKELASALAAGLPPERPELVCEDVPAPPKPPQAPTEKGRCGTCGLLRASGRCAVNGRPKYADQTCWRWQSRRRR